MSEEDFLTYCQSIPYIPQAAYQNGYAEGNSYRDIFQIQAKRYEEWGDEDYREVQKTQFITFMKNLGEQGIRVEDYNFVRAKKDGTWKLWFEITLADMDEAGGELILECKEGKMIPRGGMEMVRDPFVTKFFRSVELWYTGRYQF